MDLKLEQVLAAARARRAAMTAETAGYIALGVADALAVAPGVVREGDVVLDADGNVSVSGAARADDPSEAERSVRGLLQKLLSVSSGSSPSLSACSRRQPGNGMRALVEELEAALIPVNRAAARRAIGRLAREASKVGGIPSEPPRAAPRLPREPVAVPPPAAAPVPPAPVVREPAVRLASDVFEAATEPEYTEQIGVEAAREIVVQPPVETTPTELSEVEISEHTVPLEIIPAELTPGPAAIGQTDADSAPVAPTAPPEVPDLEIGPIIRRPAPFLEPSPLPPTPAPPTPAPPTPAPPTPAPPTPAPPTPAPVRADPHGLTPQLSTYDPHTATVAHLPPPPPESQTPAWNSSYAERNRPSQPARVVPAVQPGPRHVETAQPPDVLLHPQAPAAKPLPPTPAPPQVAELPEPSVPIDVVMSPTPPPATAALKQPPIVVEPASVTPVPAHAPAPMENPEPSVPLELVAGLTPAPPTPAPPTPAPPTPAPPTPAPPTPAPPTPAPEESSAATAHEPSASPPKAEVDGVGVVKVSGVDDLLASFDTGSKRSPREVAGELKKMVGLEPTPAPPGVASETGASLVSLPDGDQDEPAPMAPVEFRRPRAPRTAMAITTTLLILMLGAAVALYFFYPQVFLGR